MRQFEVFYSYSATGQEYGYMLFAKSKAHAMIQVKEMHPKAKYLRAFNVRNIYGEFIYKAN